MKKIKFLVVALSLLPLTGFAAYNCPAPSKVLTQIQSNQNEFTDAEGTGGLTGRWAIAPIVPPTSTTKVDFYQVSIPTKTTFVTLKCAYYYYNGSQKENFYVVNADDQGPFVGVNSSNWTNGYTCSSSDVSGCTFKLNS